MPRGILLDIEGTTSSISFVHDVMFPFVLEHLDDYLAQNFDAAEVATACDLIAVDAGFASLADWLSQTQSKDAKTLVATNIRELMQRDEKATGLKRLQGLIWQGGFDSGQLKAHVYSDVIPKIRRWRAEGIDVRIYSSGSIAAQRLFFGHLANEGNCLELFSGHYDTTIGGKKEVASYQRISEDWGLPPEEILFVSDIFEELEAASAAGLNVAASLRPGNKPMPESYTGQRIESFENLPG